MQQGTRPGPYLARLRHDHQLYLELSICAEGPIPHSEFLSWPPEDRAKAVAHHIAKNERCSMCGTAPWEWEHDRFAYEPEPVVCRGCQIREGVSNSMERADGVTVQLLPSKGREAAKRHVAAAKAYQARVQ